MGRTGQTTGRRTQGGKASRRCIRRDMEECTLYHRIVTHLFLVAAAGLPTLRCVAPASRRDLGCTREGRPAACPTKKNLVEVPRGGSLSPAPALPSRALGRALTPVVPASSGSVVFLHSDQRVLSRVRRPSLRSISMNTFAGPCRPPLRATPACPCRCRGHEPARLPGCRACRPSRPRMRASLARIALVSASAFASTRPRK